MGFVNLYYPVYFKNSEGDWEKFNINDKDVYINEPVKLLPIDSRSIYRVLTNRVNYFK